MNKAILQLTGWILEYDCMFFRSFSHDILFFQLNRENGKNEVRDSKVLKILLSEDLQIQLLERVRQNDKTS